MTFDGVLVIGLAMVIIGLAVSKGSQPERIGAGILGLSIVADLWVLALVGDWNFSVFSRSRLIIDLVELGLLLALALGANRVWPLFSAASQLLAVAGNLAVFGSEPGMEMAYWAVTQSPIFVQLFALGVGTLCHIRREAVIGNYRDWSASNPRAPE